MYGIKEQNADFDYYVSNLPKLYKLYGDCYLAIRNKEVLGTYRTYGEAISLLMPKYDIGDYIVQKCGNSPEAYTSRIIGFMAEVPNI